MMKNMIKIYVCIYLYKILKEYVFLKEMKDTELSSHSLLGSGD